MLHLISTKIRDLLPLLIHIFSTIGTHISDLEVIELDLDIPGSKRGVIDWSGWKVIDSILAGSSFKSLRKIDIELWPKGYDKEWFQKTCRALAEVLSSLGARGVSVDAHLCHGSTYQ